ncbi:MAG: amidohydrolase [Halieaceae bacterium]|nr:amidohydrolase [Halieaceae bacterium]
MVTSSRTSTLPGGRYSTSTPTDRHGSRPTGTGLFTAAIVATAALLGTLGQLCHAGDTDATADLLLLNGRVYTVTADQPWVEAMAVKDGKILATGSGADLGNYRGGQTQVIDLDGKMVMPGIIDAHLHPAWGGIKDVFQCNFAFTATPEEIAAIISQCVAAQTDSQWIIGGQWTSNFFVENPMPSPRQWLDKVSGDKAVILTDDSGHNHWANSRALQLIGIDENSEDPPGGKIGREAGTKIPNGVLEEAFQLVRKSIPEWTPEQHVRGAQYAVEAANRFGITGMKDASASPQEVAAFYQLDAEGKLTVNVASALSLDKKGALGDANIAEYEKLREQYQSPHVHTNFVKIFLDGVPTASRTAAVLEPYVPLHKDDPPNYGSMHLDPQRLADAVTELDRRGFTVKIHAAGDRSARAALDAIQQARKKNGDSGLRHEIAHAEFISEQDIPRFASLNAVADFSPYIWFPSPITDSIVDAVGEKGNYFWPARALLDSGAPMLVGSDWPSAVPDMNPWTGMEALVTRGDPQGQYPGTLWKEQAISLAEALELFTLSGARALKLEQQTGSLQPGKSADFIVLQDNLFEIPVERISDTRVQMTFFEGELVYSDTGAGQP